MLSVALITGRIHERTLAQIEVLQRHARFVDFLVKAAGGLVGIGSVRAIQFLS